MGLGFLRGSGGLAVRSGADTDTVDEMSKSTVGIVRASSPTSSIKLLFFKASVTSSSSEASPLSAHSSNK